MADGPLDPIEVLRSARDTARRLQELASKMTMPVEQRKALTDGLSRMVMPGEQLQALIDLADAFGPPQAQIAEIRDTLGSQRQQLETMLAGLDRIEQSVEWLAAASEQIVALQEPFRAIVRRFEAGSAGTGTADDGDAAEATDER